MYVRKSTDEKGNQLRSIEDQIKENKEFFKRNTLTYVDILEEKHSAKESGKRPVFRKMLTDIEAGKYTGILAWHPDRLARNMKEAGEIIDFVDKGIIRDLKFTSFTFNNDPSGKLLLGITFAMSKEYSDKLSENVNRGNRNSLDDGNYINKTKDGYYKDTDGKLRPNGAYFDLIKQAYQMRLKDGETYEKVAGYINEQVKILRAKYPKLTPIKNYRKQDVGDLFADPIYCGVTVYGKKVVDFTEIYDFHAIITPDDYITLNKGVKTGKIAKLIHHIQKAGVKADLMRGKVFCGECHNSMSSGITAKKKINKNYFYYRCDTNGCPRKNKNERAKVILEYACEYIQNNFNYSKETWEHYKLETARVHKENTAKLKNDLDGKITYKNSLENKSEQIRQRLYDTTLSVQMKADIQADYQKAVDELRQAEIDILELKKLKDEKLSIMDQNTFIELMQKLPMFITQNQQMEVLDKTLRKIFLNFTVLRKKVIKSSLNSPFDKLFSDDVTASAQERT